MNPMMLMKLKGELNAAGQRHPKFAKFVEYLTRQNLPEGTVLEIGVKAPDGQQVHSNLKLDARDLQLIQMLKQLKDN